jgi:hypothetical protein
MHQVFSSVPTCEEEKCEGSLGIKILAADKVGRFGGLCDSGTNAERWVPPEFKPFSMGGPAMQSFVPLSQSL